MSTKPPALNFQPTPRPRPLNAPDTAEALKELTRDVGFGRPTSAPPAQDLASASPINADKDHDSAALGSNPPRKPFKGAPPTSTASAGATKFKGPASRPQTEGARRSPSLRIEVDDQLWDALRLTAMRRRVTVKYLIYEALAAQGFEIDMSAVPEDGRRER